MNKNTFKNLLIIFVLFFSISAQAKISINGDSIIQSADGSFSLKWIEDHRKQDFEVIQYQTNQAKKIITTHSINADQIFLSGFQDGKYFFKIKLTDQEIYSPLLTVVVNHYSSKFSLSLFLIGLISFIAIIIMLIFYSRKEEI